MNTHLKKVFFYVRISEQDQSTYSLEAQEDDLHKKFNASTGYECIGTFRENGGSGFSFDRKVWQQLEKEMRRKKSILHAICVARYNRFSRNAGKALVFIQEAIEKYNIEVISALEPIPVSKDNPMFYGFLNSVLMQAQNEWHFITYQTKKGNVKGRSKGNPLNKAPWPYINGRNEAGEAVIKLNNQEQANIVKQIAYDYFSGMQLGMVKSRAKEAGYPRTGKSAIVRLLENPIHAGLVWVPPFDGDVGRFVKGNFQPCYEENIFWANQKRLKERGEQPKFIENANLELRGFAKCTGCGENITGGQSKGRATKYYYYFCNHCKGGTVRADRAHERLTRLIKVLNFPKPFLEIVYQRLEAHQSQKDAIAHSNKLEAEKALRGLKKKMYNLEDKYVNDLISQDSYINLKESYSLQINEQKIIVEDSKKDQEKDLAKYVDYLANLDLLYQKQGVVGKHELLKALFPGQLYLSKDLFFTAQNPLIHSRSILENREFIRLLEIWEEGSQPNYLASPPLGTRSKSTDAHLKFYPFRVKTTLLTIKNIAS